METPTLPSLDEQIAATRYGRSCTSCSKSKCRCIYRSERSACDRCHRLKRDCVPIVLARKRNVDSTTAPRRRRLEDSLEELVTVLRSQTSNIVHQTDPPSVVPPEVINTQKAHTEVVRPSDTVYDARIISSPGARALAATVPSTSASIPGIVVNANTGMALYAAPQTIDSTSTEPAISEHSPPYAHRISEFTLPESVADEQLRNFQVAFLPHFPLLHIPPGMRSVTLRQEKPFLWLTIMSLTTRSLTLQGKMGTAIRGIVREYILTDEEKSLDLLLGLLCFNSWHHYHKRERTPILIWSQLAASLAVELGIHRDAPGDKDQFCSSQTSRSQGRTLAERRAFLSTYLVTSLTWTMLRGIEPIRRTSYLDNCMRILADEKESDMDVLLVAHVKYHLVMDQMTRCLSDRALGSEASAEIPIHFVRALETQLQEINRDISPGLRDHVSMSLSRFRTEAIVKSCLLNTPNSRGTDLDFDRIQNLESIVVAVERWLRFYTEYPVHEWMGITTSGQSQFGHSIMILFKLTVLREPGWDSEYLRKRVNFMDVLEEMAKKLESIPGEFRPSDLGNVEDHGMLLKGPELLRSLRDVLSGELMKATAHDNGEMGDFVLYESLLSSDIVMDFTQEGWLNDTFGTGF